MIFLFLFLFCALLISTANSLPQIQNDISSSPTDTTQNPDYTADEPWINPADLEPNGTSKKNLIELSVRRLMTYD